MIDDDTAKVALLFMAIFTAGAASLVFFVVNQTYRRLSLVITACDLIAAPSMVMLCFLELDWRVAIGLHVAYHTFSTSCFRLILRKRFPDQTVEPRPAWPVALKGLAHFPALAAIATIDVGLLRPIPAISAMVALILTIFMPDIADRSRTLSGTARITMRLGGLMMVFAWAAACELVWRHSTLEAWFWAFSWGRTISTLVGLLVASLAIFAMRTYEEKSR